MAIIQKFRKSFGKNFLHTPLPDLVDIQYNSYKDFLQSDILPEKRKNVGLQAIFNSIFPIKDYAGSADLEFIDYSIDEPIYNVKECILRNFDYSAKLKLKLRLILWNIDENGKRILQETKEQEVYMGNVPLMTERGSFIVAGVEKVIVSQLQRAKGVIFNTSKDTKNSSEQTTFTAKIIPERGSWIDFEEIKNIIYMRINGLRKFPVTTFLKCLPCKEDEEKWIKEPRKINIKGMTDSEILSVYYNKIPLSNKNNLWIGNSEIFKNLDKFRLGYDLINPENNQIILKKGERLNRKRIEKLSSFKNFAITSGDLINQYIFDPISNQEEILFRSGTEITEEVLKDLDNFGIKEISLIAIDNASIVSHIRNTLISDKTLNREEALIELYNTIRPGERPTLETAINLFYNQGFNPYYYDLSAVGRFKMNKRLKIESKKKPEEECLLKKSDILIVLKTLINIIEKKDIVDDIDNLSNRRVRTVGELLEAEFRKGMIRVEKLVRDNLSVPNNLTLRPQDVINIKPLQSVVSEFMGISQLCQFMDAYNPLSELEHKRTISALGPGGLNRKRAGIDVRDVHPTHYGRLCPIHTPEGANVGLITHLASFARVNPYGFIETPYYKVHEGKVSNDIVYLTSDEEFGHKIAQGNTSIDKNRQILEDSITARVDGEFVKVSREEVDLIDVKPRQVISIATGLIPFIENDDAHRALMGSNMQKQVVPLLKSEAPLVGTGIEREVARDSRTVKIAKNSGIVESVDANRIVVKCMNSKNIVTGVDIYDLTKYERSNSETIIHQKPLVKTGDKIIAGDIIADGSSTHYGELAVGKNILVAFMPWHGYNFEDSIVVSERISKDDVFTSIKIIEKEVKILDTQLGPESITRDIPNVSEEALKNLDESGIVCIGANVKENDILVGRVTPKSETLPIPEEALLHHIFGDKSLNVKDSSLVVGPNEEGTVIGVNVLTRQGVKKDERTQIIELEKIESINNNRNDQIKIIEKGFADQIFDIASGNIIKQGTGSIKSFIGKKLTNEVFEAIKISDIKKIVVENKEIQDKIDELVKKHMANLKYLNDKADKEISKVTEYTSMGAGVLKEVKIYIAHKMKLQPGDKMAGRHGNKGVVSKVVPVEDMPYLEDGTPVDIVLNPLGVPSRMNVGQILETHLGMTAKVLGKQIDDMLTEIKQKRAVTDDLRNMISNIYEDEFADKLNKMTDTDIRTQAKLLKDGVPMSTPAFDGATPEDIKKMLKLAKLPETGQFKLYDGISGEPFLRPVTVGVMYMLKLHHFVEEKIHSRSTANYSLVTQQPLSGKAHRGGQRIGEMEVWALEGHGAAHLIREMLTVKSDDIIGRTKMYDAIISGSNTFKTGKPEAFNVLVRELAGLGLSLTQKRIN